MKRNRRWFTVLFALFILVMLVLSPAFVFGRTPPDWLPAGIKNWSFDVRLAIAPIAKKAVSVTNGAFADDRVYVDRHGRDVSFESQGLTMVGTIYEPEAAGAYPGILLLHGSTREGRKLGLYRVLGMALAERGYVVLSMDRRGYGDSDDPPNIDSLDDLTPVSDFTAGLDYLASLSNVDGDRLFTIGHSAGTDLAIKGGIEEARIHKIVAIGPRRRVQERIGSEHDPEWDYFQRRTMRYMELSQSIPKDVALMVQSELPLESHLEYFSSAEHKPILLIDGMLESKADRAFLQQFCASISNPKACYTQPDADHYSNVANFGSVIIFDERAVDLLIRIIDAWLAND